MFGDSRVIVDALLNKDKLKSIDFGTVVDEPLSHESPQTYFGKVSKVPRR